MLKLFGILLLVWLISPLLGINPQVTMVIILMHVLDDPKDLYLLAIIGILIDMLNPLVKFFGLSALIYIILQLVFKMIQKQFDLPPAITVFLGAILLEGLSRYISGTNYLGFFLLIQAVTTLVVYGGSVLLKGGIKGVYLKSS